MAREEIIHSKFSVQFSILIGKYLPPKLGYRISRSLANLLGSFENWDLNQAIRANQYIAADGDLTRQELVLKTKQVLNHAAHCYYDLYHFYNKPELLDNLVPLSEPMREFIKITREDQGYMVVAPHLSNFDLVVTQLVLGGFKGKVLSFPNPGSGYKLQNQIRESFGIEVTPLGDSRLEGELIQYLKDGGVTATGIDRPVPDRKKRHYVEFFGRPSPLPVGYITTALAADVPIIAVSAYMTPEGQYGFRHSGPIQLKKLPNKLDEILYNAEMIMEFMEEYIKLIPEQWLMYYPVWPELLNENL
ncbi:MAG: lysophospholipid acyltransferase family protein [Chloroflexi bacterium]|nr:lysophospholipid acyltransferase family protein [Chloroflexota bacterium]